MSNKEDIPKIDAKDEQESKNIIQSYLKQDNIDNKVSIVHSDKMLDSDIDYIKANNESFNQLLDAYVNNTSRNLKAKLKFKIVFFIICIGILVIISALMVGVTIYCLRNNIDKETLIVSMISSIVSFTASFIVLPHTIANYLFNTEEEKDMTELIKNIQEHDKIIRDGLKKS